EADVIAYKHRIAASSDKNPHVIIHIKLPDGTIYPHPGLTNLLDIQVQSDTDTVVVRAQLPNTEGMLIPAGIVGVMVERGAPPQSLAVAQAAGLFDAAGDYGMLVNDV